MNKDELKTILKPLIKQCIKEVIFEDGTLSTVISEVVKGLGNPLTESRPLATQSTGKKMSLETKEQAQARRRKLQESREKVMSSVGRDAYNGVNVFEGLEPMPQKEPSKGQADLGDPRDSGVDISDLIGNASDIWKAIK